MAYTKTTWVDGGPPGISASNLNKIEQGIYDAHQQKVSKSGDTMTGKLTAPSYGSVDTRDTPTSPGDYKSEMRLQFKYLSSIGLNGIASGTYCQLVGYRAWDNDTGGRAHEVAFTDGGDIYYRNGTEAGGWGPWQKLWHAGNLSPSTSATANTVAQRDGNGDLTARVVKPTQYLQLPVLSSDPSSPPDGAIWMRS